MRINKHFKALTLALLVAAVLALGGCQLALEDQAEAAAGDVLVGVLVTQDYLDLFDMEGYLNDNLGQLVDGGEIRSDGSGQQYQGRLYATLTLDERGQAEDYVFPGVEGIACMSVRVPATAEGDSYISSGSDPALSDKNMHVIVTDEEDRTELSGTIYVAPSRTDQPVYVNPVYQSADGSVYAISGNGFQADGSTDEGLVYASTVEDSSTWTENGESKTVSMWVEIAVNVMFPPERIVLLQLDADSNILERTEYAPGQLPERLTLAAETEFILAETHKQAPDGRTVVSRELRERPRQEDKEILTTYLCREDGICVQHHTTLRWPVK